MNNFLKFIYQVFLGLSAGMLTMAIIEVWVYTIPRENWNGVAFAAAMLHFIMIGHWFSKGATR